MTTTFRKTITAVALVAALSAGTVGCSAATPTPVESAPRATTEAPQSLPVPSISGLTVTEAVLLLDNAGLQVSYSDPSAEYDGDNWIVSNSSPVDGTQVQPNTTVILNVRELAQEPQTAPAPAPAPETDTGSRGEEAYLYTMKTEPYFATLPDADLLEVGYVVCTALGQSMPLDSLLALALQNGIPAHEAGVLVGASVGALCPEYTPLVEQYLSQGGANS